MASTNGSGKRMDRVEQAIEQLAASQKELFTDHQRLLTAQVILNERISELAEAQKITERRVAALAESHMLTDRKIAEVAEMQKHTDERLGILVATVDSIIRDRPRPQQ